MVELLLPLSFCLSFFFSLLLMGSNNQPLAFKSDQVMPCMPSSVKQEVLTKDRRVEKKSACAHKKVQGKMGVSGLMVKGPGERPADKSVMLHKKHVN